MPTPKRVNLSELPGENVGVPTPSRLIANGISTILVLPSWCDEGYPPSHGHITGNVDVSFQDTSGNEYVRSFAFSIWRHEEEKTLNFRFTPREPLRDFRGGWQ